MLKRGSWRLGGGGGNSSRATITFPSSSCRPVGQHRPYAAMVQSRLDDLVTNCHQTVVYYEGLSTVVLHNRFIHIQVQTKNRRLVLSTPIHKVNPLLSQSKRDSLATEFNRNSYKNHESSLVWCQDQMLLSKNTPLEFLKYNTAFERILTEIVMAAEEADKLFMGEDKNHRSASQHFLLESMNASPSSANKKRQTRLQGYSRDATPPLPRPLTEHKAMKTAVW